MGSSLTFLWMLVQTVFALGLVCGLAYLIFRVILPRLTITQNSNNMIRVVDRVGLESRKSLYIIEVAGKWMLVAVSENGTQLISELDAAAAKEAEQLIVENRLQSKGFPFGKTFADKLNEVMNRKPGGK